MTTVQRLPVSVCIIAGAEAQRIRGALESVSDWAAEIIVVINDDVLDGTDRIAASCGAKIFREPWKGYVAQKNSAAEKADQPWILSLDADEAVSTELREEIRCALAAPGQHAGFSFPRCTRFCGRWIRHGDWYPDRKVRLWQRGRGRWAGSHVHETLEVNGPVGRLYSDLLHDTAETIDRQIAKISGYSNEFLRESKNTRQAGGGWALFVRPPWRFLRGYVFRLGFLDGWQGYYIAWMTGFYTVTRYAKVLQAVQEPTAASLNEDASRASRPHSNL